MAERKKIPGNAYGRQRRIESPSHKNPNQVGSEILMLDIIPKSLSEELDRVQIYIHSGHYTLINPNIFPRLHEIDANLLICYALESLTTRINQTSRLITPFPDDSQELRDNRKFLVRESVRLRKLIKAEDADKLDKADTTTERFISDDENGLKTAVQEGWYRRITPEYFSMLRGLYKYEYLPIQIEALDNHIRRLTNLLGANSTIGLEKVNNGSDSNKKLRKMIDVLETKRGQLIDELTASY